MDRLPTELLIIILHHLYYVSHDRNAFENLEDWQQSGGSARYAVVSSRWQGILEPMIWRNINVLEPYALIWLEAYTSGKQHRIARTKWVRRILWVPYINPALAERFCKALNDYPVALACVLPYQYHRLCRQAFAGIFRILSRWESICDESIIELSLITDNSNQANLPMLVSSWNFEDATVEGLWQMGLTVLLVHLTRQDASAYRVLHNVGSLILEPAMTDMRPSAFFQLLSQLPNVRHVSAAESAIIEPFTHRALREQRQQLVHSLPLVPPSVEEFEYKIAPEREMSWTPDLDAANYLSVRGLDELSIAFRTLSMRLRELRLSNVRVNSELFWASPEEDRVIADTLHWPVLEFIIIRDTPPYTADGKWILDEDPTMLGTEEFDDRMWDYDEMGFDVRRLLRSGEVDKVYSAMGKAAQRMPRLRYLEFRFRGEIPGQDDRESLIFERDLETGAAHLAITTEWEYDLGEEVITAWGLECEEAEELRAYWSVDFDQWTPKESARRA